MESAGGTVTTSYYNPVALRAHLFPEKYEQDPLRVFPRRALPKKKTMKYYLNPENRGYLLTDAGEERLKVYIIVYTGVIMFVLLLIQVIYNGTSLIRTPI